MTHLETQKFIFFRQNIKKILFKTKQYFLELLLLLWWKKNNELSLMVPPFLGNVSGSQKPQKIKIEKD